MISTSKENHQYGDEVAGGDGDEVLVGPGDGIGVRRRSHERSGLETGGHWRRPVDGGG